MRIDDLFLVKDQNLEEGPVWDKTRKVGANIAKGIGGVSQAVGAVAGVPSGIIRGMAKGYNRASDTIAGGPDENPQQSSGENPQQPQGQSAGSSFAQGLQGGASSGGGAGGGAVAGKLRQQAKQLMSMADELEKGGAEPQGQQSAPPTQAPQAQEPPDASSSQLQSTVQAPSADAQAYLDTHAKETPASAGAANASTTSSTDGSYNNQIGNGKANYGVTTHFDPNIMQNVSTTLDPKAVGVVPTTTNPTTNNKADQEKQQPGQPPQLANTSKVVSQVGDPRDLNKDGVVDPIEKSIARKNKGKKKVPAAAKQTNKKPSINGLDVVNMEEGVQYYSRFLKTMI